MEELQQDYCTKVGVKSKQSEKELEKKVEKKGKEEVEKKRKRNQSENETEIPFEWDLTDLTDEDPKHVTLLSNAILRLTHPVEVGQDRNLTEFNAVVTDIYDAWRLKKQRLNDNLTNLTAVLTHLDRVKNRRTLIKPPGVASSLTSTQLWGPLMYSHHSGRRSPEAIPAGDCTVVEPPAGDCTVVEPQVAVDIGYSPTPSEDRLSDRSWGSPRWGSPRDEK